MKLYRLGLTLFAILRLREVAAIYVDMGRQFPSRYVLLQHYAEVAYLLGDSQYIARSERNFVLS